MALNYADSEDEPDAYQATFEELHQRDDEIKRFKHQQMIEALLENAKLAETEPIKNFIDQSDGRQVSCKVADDHLVRLKKTYPMQKSVWPHILNGKSIILIGNTDYYPHLVYLPPVCDLIKVKFLLLNEVYFIFRFFIHYIHGIDDAKRRH